MTKFNTSIIWPKRKYYSSSNARKHPYLLERIKNPNPKIEKHAFINHCNNVFDAIAENRRAIKANGGKTTGIELKDFQDD